MLRLSASTPYAPPAQDPSQWVDLETMVNTRLPNFGYQVFFASSDATQIIQSNVMHSHDITSTILGREANML